MYSSICEIRFAFLVIPAPIEIDDKDTDVITDNRINVTYTVLHQIDARFTFFTQENFDSFLISSPRVFTCIANKNLAMSRPIESEPSNTAAGKVKSVPTLYPDFVRFEIKTKLINADTSEQNTNTTSLPFIRTWADDIGLESFPSFS